MTQDKNINNLIINKLTKAQYDNIQNPSATELYLVTDDIGITSNDIITALGYTPYNATNPSNFITNTVSDLTNYYLKSETCTKLEVQQLIASIPKFTVLVVQELPLTGQPMTLYLVPKDGEAPDVYNEYVWVSDTNTFELIGSTAVDLDGYATEDWVINQGYLSSISQSDIVSALGFTPYSSTNPNNYISGITSSDVITALSYTPYNGATNPNGYITSADLPTNYVTTDTAQDISGKKTFLGEKAIYFKQQATSNKLGFTLYNPSNAELGALEYRPNTISGNALLNLNCPQTTGGYVGFRYWGSPAINIVAPKPSTAGDYYIPTHITNGNTTVTASNTGTVNISTLLPDISTKQDTLVSGTNIKTINNTSLLGSGNIDTKEVFIAEYGTTTYAEVMSALQSHKIVFVIKNGFIYTYQTVSGLMNLFVRWCYYFNGSSNIDGVDAEGVYVNQNDVWKTTSNIFEFQQLLVSGTNIKTINNQSILGSGNLSISIPTAISDLTDDTATNPIDKADTLTGLTASITELNYTDGVTSNIQTQLNSKVNSSDIWYDSTTSTLYIGVAQS